MRLADGSCVFDKAGGLAIFGETNSVGINNRFGLTDKVEMIALGLEYFRSWSVRRLIGKRLSPWYVGGTSRGGSSCRLLDLYKARTKI